MSEFALSAHAKEMLAERNIAEEWVWRTINTPARKQMGEDGNLKKKTGEFCAL